MFRIGDIVECKEGNRSRYNVTLPGNKCVVVNIGNPDAGPVEMMVKVLNVQDPAQLDCVGSRFSVGIKDFRLIETDSGPVDKVNDGLATLEYILKTYPERVIWEGATPSGWYLKGNIPLPRLRLK